MLTAAAGHLTHTALLFSSVTATSGAHIPYTNYYSGSLSRRLALLLLPLPLSLRSAVAS
jgi:hypothetical protein